MSRLDFVKNIKEQFVDGVKTYCTKCNKSTFYSVYKKIPLDADQIRNHVNIKNCSCGNDEFAIDYIFKNLGIKIIKGWIGGRGKGSIKVHSRPKIRTVQQNGLSLSIVDVNLGNGREDDDEVPF